MGFVNMYRAGLTLALLAGVLAPAGAGDSLPGVYSVLDFGAAPDGETDATDAFQAAMNAAHEAGGGVVKVPRGVFAIKGRLDLPKDVTLEGLWRAPQRGIPFGEGVSVLLAFTGRDDIDGPAFITMHENSVLKGITVFYPEQVRANPPVPYSWTIRGGGGDNVTIIDVTLINPYQAVDFGTKASGRHYIRNLHGYPLYKGLYVNQCYDVGRLENIHFWPFWDVDPNSPLWVFTRENATSFIFGKTDGEMATGLFSIFYNVAMHFIAGPVYRDGERIGYEAGSGMFTNCYLDVTPTAILVDEAMPHAGISFVNCSIMAKVVVSPSNRGPVKFSACGFWGVPNLDSQAVLAGRGPVIFDACHFNGWGRDTPESPCIVADNHSLTVTGSWFNLEHRGQPLIELRRGVRAAVITSNLMPQGENIVNNAPGNAAIQIAHNAVAPAPEFVTEWLVVGPFPNPDIEAAADGLPTRAGYDKDYLAELGGEAAAVLREGDEIRFEDDGAPGAAEVRRIRTGRGGLVEFHRLYRVPNHVAYAFAYLHSDIAQTVRLEFGMNDGGKIWLNGEEVHARFFAGGRQCVPGQFFAEAELKPGKNPLLVKIEDAGGSRWEFVLEAYGEDGKGLAVMLE